MQTRKPRQKSTWAQFIPDEEWATYEAAIRIVRKAKVEFLIGGAFGLAVYTGRWRNTKDLDLLVLPSDRDAVVQSLTDSGFADYYDERPYDRGWIYRATKDGFIVDVIWAMANRRAEVDKIWFERAPAITVRGGKLRAVPAEELLWHKIYVLQRDRCDWPDVWNLLYENGPTLDWEHLLNRFENDLPLLKAALVVFDWICPAAANELPDKVRERLCLSKRVADESADWKRNVSLLDSRAWFAGLEAVNEKLGH